MNNGKKEYPQSGLEYDGIMKWDRRYLCYINNIPHIKKYIKNRLNRRFRRHNKKINIEE